MRTFFQQQFSPESTSAQITFDVIFGIVAPVVCIAVDVLYLDSLAANLPAVSYAVIGIGIVVLALWLFLNSYIESLLIEVAAVALLCGALYAIITGAVLFYFTCWGLLSGIMTTIEDSSMSGVTLTAVSLLGFMPFLTAFVFLRNGFRALQRARSGGQD